MGYISDFEIFAKYETETDPNYATKWEDINSALRDVIWPEFDLTGVI
jgi:hypothetical protein